MTTVGGDESRSSELKPNKNGRIGETDDRISNLPDAIIHHIFSFISIVDVTRTSVLAKRWRYLWTQIPNLHFDDSQVLISEREDAFLRFVNGVLSLYKAPKIERFCLSVQQQRNAYFVDDWVRFAVQMNVAELNVELNTNMELNANIVLGDLRKYTVIEPFEMLCCGSVRDLRLHLGGRRLMLPVTGTFSSLKTLSLSSVVFINGTILNTVSKQCPRLKSLSFSNCTGLQHLDVSHPLLQDLEVRRWEGLAQLTVSAEKLQSLSVHDSFTYGIASVKILAPSLQSFSWLDYIVGEDKFYIENFTSLKSARISLVVDYYPEDKDLYLKSARNLLGSLSCAESLAVEIACFWNVSTHRDLLEGLWTPPHNLKHMTLLVGFDDDVFRGISYLFKSCPNLETLEIQTVDEETDKQLKNRFPDPSLFEGVEHLTYQSQPLNHLQEASMYGFRGEEYEIEFVEYLLNNSAILKRMTVLFSSKVSLDDNAKAVVAQRLMELKRASPNAIVRVF